MFKMSKRIAVSRSTTGNVLHLYIPAVVRDIYQKVADHPHTSPYGYVTLYGDEETGIIVVVPPQARKGGDWYDRVCEIVERAKREDSGE